MTQYCIFIYTNNESLHQPSTNKFVEKKKDFLQWQNDAKHVAGVQCSWITDCNISCCDLQMPDSPEPAGPKLDFKVSAINSWTNTKACPRFIEALTCVHFSSSSFFIAIRHCWSPQHVGVVPLKEMGLCMCGSAIILKLLYKFVLTMHIKAKKNSVWQEFL